MMLAMDVLLLQHLVDAWKALFVLLSFIGPRQLPARHLTGILTRPLAILMCISG
jgi:hypothetical protein